MEQRTCTHGDCTDKHVANGLCRFHWQRAHNGTDLDAPRRKPRGTVPCSVGACGGWARSKGLCAGHYMKQYERPTTCSVDGCGSAEHARTYCLAHYHISTKFNIDPEVWERMYTEQGGRCLICSDPITRRQAHTDHDHACCPSTARSCGKCIRGLLCRGCNHGLGAFKDSPDRLAAAVGYLTIADGQIGNLRLIQHAT